MNHCLIVPRLHLYDNDDDGDDNNDDNNVDIADQAGADDDYDMQHAYCGLNDTSMGQIKSYLQQLAILAGDVAGWMKKPNWEARWMVSVSMAHMLGCVSSRLVTGCIW